MPLTLVRPFMKTVGMLVDIDKGEVGQNPRLWGML